jgi:hypothetical protein
MPNKSMKKESISAEELFLPLFSEIRVLICSARRAASHNINTLLVITNFEIGRRIVEYEQKGSRGADYGEQILTQLSIKLSEEFGRGFSTTNLKYMRRFYLEYHAKNQYIPETIFQKSQDIQQFGRTIGQTVSDQFI